MFNKLLTWLVVSSANPNEFSYTLKGILLQWAGIALFVFSYFHLPFTENQYFDFVGSLTTVLGTALGVFGLLRKLYFEVKSLFPQR